MDLQRIDLNLMVAFEALMAERSVSQAAIRLGISQPAMSGTLARLRTLFGDALFVRDGRRMLPTARATALDTQVAQALAQLRAALAPPDAFDPATSRRVFTISGGDYATMVLLPRLVATLARAAPSVDLRFRYIEKDAVFARLDDDGLDLALGVYRRPPKRLCLEPLFTERFVCVASRDHPQLRDGLTLETFLALPHALVSERGDASGAVDEALATLGLARHVRLVVPHVLVLASVLPGSALIASVGERAARLFAESGRIERHELPLSIAPWRLAMLWSRQKASDAGLAWLRQSIRAIDAGKRAAAADREPPDAGRQS